MILHSSVRPTKGWRSRTRRRSTSEAGRKPAKADVEDEPALDDLDDRPLDDPLLLLDLLDRAPGALVLRPLLGEDQPAVLVLLGEDEGLELLVERDDLVGVDVVADRELARRDDALGLVPDVEQHLVAVDLDDLAGDDVAVVELDDRRVDGVGERLAAEIVEDDRAVGDSPLSLGSVAIAASGGGAVPASPTSCSRTGALAPPVASCSDNFSDSSA